MRAIVAWCIALALAGEATAAPIVIPAGNSSYQCGPCSADFSSSPIPADFFAPGSDPFQGGVLLGGVPLDPQPAGTSPAFLLGGPAAGTVLNLNWQSTSPVDTVVQRLGDIVLPGTGDQDVIPIEIVQLNLVSVQPIIVTYNGGQDPEPWSVELVLPPVQPPGQMTVTRTHLDGGTVQAILPVHAIFVFTRVDTDPDGLPGTEQVPGEFQLDDTLSYSGTFSLAPVPTPGTGALLAVGLLAGHALRRRVLRS
jgi:hypothetical protein